MTSPGLAMRRSLFLQNYNLQLSPNGGAISPALAPIPFSCCAPCEGCTTLRAMAKTYRPYVPEQDLLLPPSLREWLPENHLAFFVSDLIDQLDLSAILAVYEDEGRGYPPYHPVMLTKVLVYAYCVGVFSSRKIQRRLVEDVAFRVLAAGNEPDFRTIADFRKTHLAALKGFF
jgi:transposase